MLWYEETYNFRVLTSATTSVVEISGFVVLRGVPDVSITLIGRVVVVVVVVVVVDSDLIINVIELLKVKKQKAFNVFIL